MRGLRDISKLAAVAALVFGVAGWGTLGCSAQDSDVDAAPPMEGELVEIDEIEIDETGAIQEEDEQY